MGYDQSDRRETLPSNWKALRRAVFARDGGICVWLDAYGQRCPEAATDCDHILDRNDHSLNNLRSLCSWHHDQRSAGQGGAAAAKARAAKNAVNRKRFSREQKHPGDLS